MYLWIGLGVEKSSGNYIRDYCRNINKKYNLNEQSFTLPQHISLKTSFDIDNYIEVINYLKNKFTSNKKLTLTVDKVGKVPGLIWLEIEETEELRNYHNQILKYLKSRFKTDGIGFDGDSFKFHSTLFQDLENKDKVELLYNEFDKEEFKNKKIEADKIYFGISEIGKVGTYKVVDYVNLK